MKSKAPLALMEQIVMVLVFALTAALCLRMFVLADQLSRKYAATDRAVLEAQNAAEWLKQGQQDVYFEKMHAVDEPDAKMIFYDKNWEVTGFMEKADYILQVIYADSGICGLWKAEIVVFAGENELFRIPVTGQKAEVEEDA